MLDVLKFILDCVIDFLEMLFTIDVGNNMSLGLIMCVIFIFLPLVLVFLNFIKVQFINEIDEAYDTGRRFFGFRNYTGRHSKKYLDRRK